MYVTTDTAKVYGTDVLIYTSITNYRINANNTLTALYKEVQATNIATEGQGYQTIYETYNQWVSPIKTGQIRTPVEKGQRLAM